MDTELYMGKKDHCRKALIPFLEMLEEQRSSMSVDQWLAQLSKTESRVHKFRNNIWAAACPMLR